MNEQRIREIANQASTHAEDTVDYYSGIVDGLTWEAKILKARDLKFAELIVRECVQSIERTIETSCEFDSEKMGCEFAITDLKKHFGVEE